MKVTILTCTPDINSEVFKKHSEALKKYTSDFEWLIFDNNNASEFNHAREINRAMLVTSNKYLLILDDDLIVTESWLEGLLNSVSNAEIIGGLHRYANGEINHAGGYILSNGSAGHFLGHVEKLMYVQYVCSAVMLINLEFAKKNKLCFDEGFSKYFQETDYCLRVWEAGGRVAITNKCDVFHLVGKVVGKLSDRYKMYSLDSRYFKRKWIETGKLKLLMTKINGQLNSDYSNSVKKISELLLEYTKALKSRDVDALKRVNKKSENFSDYDHGMKINNESALHINKILSSGMVE